jgi:hypothetical protein
MAFREGELLTGSADVHVRMLENYKQLVWSLPESVYAQEYGQECPRSQ